MRRREFIALAGATAAWPIAARAQQGGRIARIGLFTSGHTSPITTRAYRGFLDELRRLGFGAGQNLFVDVRRSDQEVHGLFAAAAEMVSANAEMIVSAGPEAALQAVIAASSSIPIVIVAINYDPIARGYVNSLAQPGGNVTGVFLRQPELAEKQVELLTQAFPARSRLALLW